ncbi:PPC domain-containing protein [Anabaena azotica]|uniref:Pre-peptidase C-terminal domain-containing protein n=1 Tax=Anabaena azotica FACHB-119 TaxID=947527 RepID=A0ABR8D0M4_9NOST|nr:PPC domain-containing protein [Anabaena azotica]MBD2500284.1 pre-peptidase C-terminal domain-containing protein [Anabaena azotica FACHB-119]
MVGQKKKSYWFKLNYALIVSISGGLLVANYAPIKALDIALNPGKLIIAKTPDERQPEAVQQAIEQIPTSSPPATPQTQPKQSIDSPIPVRESSNSTSNPNPQPRETNSTPRQSPPTNSNPNPQPRETNSTPRQSPPANSNPNPQPRETNSTPRQSPPTNSNSTRRSRETNSASPQRGRQSIPNSGRGRNSTSKTPLVSLSNPSFRDINFVDIAFGVLSKGDFQSQGRYFHFYKFEGRENQLLQIRLGGSADSRRSGNLSLNPFMFLLDPDNKVILKRGAVGTNGDIRDAFVFVRLPVKGTYTIAVTSRNPGDTGRYSLALRNDRASYILDESAELNAQSSVIKQNRSPYNVSQFQGKKNQLVSIRVDSINEEFSPYIVLLNSQGKTIAADNDKDGMYSALIDRARLPEDDTYYIVVTANNSTNRGTYRLTLF